jgi:hypothetical protein
MRFCATATVDGCPARGGCHCSGEADQERVLEAVPELVGKKARTVCSGGLLGVAGGGAVSLVFGLVGDAGSPRMRVWSCSLVSEEDTDVGSSDAGSLTADGWYLLFTVNRPSLFSSMALMKEWSESEPEPQSKGEEGGVGGSCEELRMPVGVVRDFTVEEVFVTLEARYTVQEGVVYGCEGLALGRPVGLEASGRQARKRRNCYRANHVVLLLYVVLRPYTLPCTARYALRGAGLTCPGRVGVQGSRGTDEEIS